MASRWPPCCSTRGGPPVRTPRRSCPSRPYRNRSRPTLRRSPRCSNALCGSFPRRSRRPISITRPTQASARSSRSERSGEAGTPFVLTEHDTYLTADILAETSGRPGVRAVLLRFLRSLARLAYHEATQIAAPTERLRRWALDHGADPTLVTVVGYGVDPHSCPPLRGEPAEPTITFLGPDRDAVTLLRTLPRLRAVHPDIRLIVGAPPVSDRRDHLRRSSVLPRPGQPPSLGVRDRSDRRRVRPARSGTVRVDRGDDVPAPDDLPRRRRAQCRGRVRPPPSCRTETRIGSPTRASRCSARPTTAAASRPPARSALAASLPSVRRSTPSVRSMRRRPRIRPT